MCRSIVARYRRYGLALLLLVPLLSLPAMGRAQEGNRAGVIVVKGDGEVLTACVTFSEPTISGMGLLERSGLDFTLQASGGNATVCSIAGEGCGFPGEGCFCQCQGGGSCRYWSYWHQNGGVWQYATTGAPLHRVPPGGIDAWTWGEGTGGAAPRPPAITFDAICPVPTAPTLMPAISPSPEPTPSATSTLASSPTSAPSASATSTATIASEPPATPTLASPPATPTPVAEQPSHTVSYLLFGGTLAFLLTGLALAWRRRR